MKAEAPPDIKRRRISAADSSPQGVICLSDLPSGILAHAANFLAPPSRAFFAVALDENSSASPNERSSAIAGNQWDVLDFGDIEKELAAKLTDDHIENVLLCIDAVNKLKRLKLTNCVNITGAGLEPLRGSLKIELIDLSLVGEQQSPRLSPEPPISRDHALPILDSIVEREGCSLKYIQFPLVWRKRENASTHPAFHAFIVRYNQIRRNWGVIGCLGGCNETLPRHRNEWLSYYGTQRHTCYGCLKHYCYHCEIEEMERERPMMSECTKCERDYCVDCLNMQWCRSCDGYTCHDCCENGCKLCGEEICSGCFEEYKCEDCDKILCPECNDEEGEGVVRCEECHVSCCDDCRWRRLQQGRQSCAECIRGMAPLLAYESKRSYEDNEQLKIENKELKLEIKELRSRNSD